MNTQRLFFGLMPKSVVQRFRRHLIGGGVLPALSPLTVHAQVDCSLPAPESVNTGEGQRGLSCGGNNPLSNPGGDFDLKYSQQSSWVPTSSTQTLTIPVAIHIFQDQFDQGTGIYNLLVSAPNGTSASANWIKQ